MALVDVGAIRTALAERCRTLPGLWAYDYPTDALQTGPAGAALIADPDTDVVVAYHQVGSADDVTITFDVQIIVQATDAAEAQRLIDEYRGVGTERSIMTLLESTGTLDGATGSVTVLSAGTMRVYGDVQEGPRHWYVTFSVEVLAG